MKKFITPIIIFFLTAIIYFSVATNFTFKPKWALDYYNLLAGSLMNFRLDLSNPPATYDLSYFGGRWYLPMGILPAVFLIPLQIIKQRFIPTIYLSILFGSLNVVLIYLLLIRLKEDFLPKLSLISIYLVTMLFAFGTMNFYVGTLGSYWHVNQMVSSFWGTLGLYLVFKRKRSLHDYFWSVWSIALTLIGRSTLIYLIVIPIVLYMMDFVQAKKQAMKLAILKRSVIIFILPLFITSTIFLAYNYLRFQNIFEYGYTYIQEASNLAEIRLKNGIVSLANFPRNLWLMTAEFPRLIWTNNLQLELNLNGNSIFFLTPPLIAIFFAWPWSKVKGQNKINYYVLSLWLGFLLTMLPSLLFYSSGWMQFGYRYALDVMPILALLSVFGIKGKMNFLYIFGIIFAILFHWLGIQALK